MSGQLCCQLRMQNGVCCTLPPLRSWSFLRTDGNSCDAFEITFAPSDSLLQALPQAVGLTAAANAVRVFTGLVDEYELSLNANGTEVRLCGRGMGAALLDNQLTARTYINAQLPDILCDCVWPFGISAEQPKVASIPNFAVSTGESCMQTLKGFCAAAALLPPYFDAAGSLLLRSERTDSGLYLKQEQLLQAVYRDCRYGVISKQSIIHLKTGDVAQAIYPAFIRRGGRCCKVTCLAGDLRQATWRDATQRIDEARREEYRLCVTLEGNFLVPPAQTVQVELPKLAASGTYYVAEALSSGSGAGCTCTLTLLRQEDL